MAHNTRVRADFAAWATGVVTQTEFNKLDENQFKAINGDDGGVWAPSSQIEIGGSGLNVSGPFLTSGNAEIGVTSGDSLTVWATSTFVGPTSFGLTTFSGSATFNASLTANGNVTLGNASSDTLTVIASATFENDVTIGVTSSDALLVWSTSTFIGPTSFGLTTFSGSSTFNGSAEFNSSVQFDSGVTFNNQATFNGGVDIGNSSLDALLVQATAAFNAEAIFNNHMTLGSSSVDQIAVVGTATLYQPLLTSGSGRVTTRGTLVGDSSTTVTTATAQVFYLPTGTLSTNRSITISDTGAVDGDMLWFVIGGAQASTWILQFPASVPVAITAGQLGYLIAHRISGTWRVLVSDFS